MFPFDDVIKCKLKAIVEESQRQSQYTYTHFDVHYFILFCLRLLIFAAIFLNVCIKSQIRIFQGTGVPFQPKDVALRFIGIRNPIVEILSSYLCSRISYSGKISLHWLRDQVS